MNVADVCPRVEVGAYPLHLAAKRGRVPVLEAGLNDVTDDRGSRHPKALGFSRLTSASGVIFV